MRTVQGSSTTDTTPNNSTHHPGYSEKDCPDRLQWLQWTGSGLREVLPESVEKHGGKHQRKKKDVDDKRWGWTASGGEER